jgi:methylphosphotriester-DNA--protein-cysteine methyltransferase
MIYEEPRIYRVAVARSVVNRTLGEMAKPSPPADWRVEGLLRFIEKEGGKLGWDLNGVCAQLQLGISGSHAAKLFSRHTGMGIREYAKQVRLTRAAMKLRTTPDSVKQIALDLGYRNPNDLRRQFNKLFSLNPTEFRAMYRQPVCLKDSEISRITANVRRLGRGAA